MVPLSQPVPEPRTFALVLAGLGLLGIAEDLGRMNPTRL
jgi:hypothetical protein